MDLYKKRRDNPLVIWRRTHGLSRIELASQLGISDTCVYKWESGTMKPSPDSFEMLSKFTGVDDLRERWTEWLDSIRHDTSSNVSFQGGATNA